MFCCNQRGQLWALPWLEGIRNRQFARRACSARCIPSAWPHWRSSVSTAVIRMFIIYVKKFRIDFCQRSINWKVKKNKHRFCKSYVKKIASNGMLCTFSVLMSKAQSLFIEAHVIPGKSPLTRDKNVGRPVRWQSCWIPITLPAKFIHITLIKIKHHSKSA